MSDIIIREMETADLGQVQKLMDQLNDIFETQHDISSNAIADTFAAMNNQKGFYTNYVAVADNMVAGFISMVIYKTFFHTKGTLLINELVVDRELRGKGIGEKLLQAAIRFASDNNLNEVEVGTMFDNKAAIAFYKKNGLKDESLLLGKELNE